MTQREEEQPSEGGRGAQQAGPVDGGATAEASNPERDPAPTAAGEQRRLAETYLDLAQRTQADFVNYKRRMEQERERVVREANAELLRQILPALDDLERALAHVPSEIAEDGWVQGVSLVGQKIQAVLGSQGLERIGTAGEQFDPRIHEAVAYEEHPGFNEGQVATVYRPGYRLYERVLRPAQVVVARAPAESSTESGRGRE